MAVLGVLVLLLLLPRLLLVQGHHRIPRFCELRDSTNSLVDQRACRTGRDCIGGPLSAVIEGSMVDYYYCKMANSPVSNTILNAFMRKKIMGYTCYLQNSEGRVIHDYACPPGSECSRGPIMFEIPGQGYSTVKFCMVKDYKGPFSWLVMY